MPYTHLNLREEDVVRLVLEFLHNRDLHIAQLSLERETGVINGNFSDDMLFLRQLILDGQWDDVLEFIQPLEALPSFNISQFNYTILRHKYVELLCIKSESAADNNVNNAVEEVVKVLNDLQKLAPSKDEYSNLCLLLTLPRLTDHVQFKKWNPSNARVQCFREVYPLVEHFLPSDKKATAEGVTKSAENDRLVQLIIKGILYEFCVNFCGAKANGSQDNPSGEVNFSQLLDGFPLNESDLSLLCWLQSIPGDTFTVPFTRRTLNVDIERLERPSLETSWTEHMFVTPIKPKTFPHSAMPFTRPRSAADAMTRSLRPLPEGAPHPALSGLMAQSVGDYHSSVVNSCFAGFHLTGIKSSKLMNSSVDRLFENENFSGNGHAEFARLNPISEGKLGTSPGARGDSPERKKSQPPSEDSTARSSRRDSLSEKPGTTPSPGSTVPFPQSMAMTTTCNRTSVPVSAPAPAAVPLLTPPSSSAANSELPSSTVSPSSSDATARRDLLREYQMQKQRVLANKVTKDLVQQMHDTRIVTDSSSAAATGPPLTIEAGLNGSTHAAPGPPRPSLPTTNNQCADKNTEGQRAHYDAVKGAMSMMFQGTSGWSGPPN